MCVETCTFNKHQNLKFKRFNSSSSSNLKLISTEGDRCVTIINVHQYLNDTDFKMSEKNVWIIKKIWS
jgi:hypothetical protein